MAPAPSFDSCEFLAPSGRARLQLFRADAPAFATSGEGNPTLQIGILLRGQVRTETPSGLLVSDARESPQIWVLPAHMPFAVTALPGHAPALLGAAIEPAAFGAYLQEATPARVAAPAAPMVLRDPVAALGLEAFHRSLWSGAAPLEWESWLVTSLRRLFSGGSQPPPCPPSAEPRGVALAREYLHAHYRDAVPLDHLAALAGVSKYHLVRAFRAAVGAPPHTYQLRLRLTRSLFLLRHGLSPAAIAQELGFADQSHFTRAFRAEFGTTPAAWLRASGPARARPPAPGPRATPPPGAWPTPRPPPHDAPSRGAAPVTPAAAW